MLTKTKIHLLEYFTSTITNRYSIREVALALKKPYALTYRAAQELLKEEYLMKEKGGITLNIRKHHETLAYIESLRTEQRIAKESLFRILIEDLAELKEDFFTLLIFGSAVTKKTYRDVDLLLIAPNREHCEHLERALRTLTGRYTAPFDIQAISIESAYEMLNKREQTNIMNEALNNHLILFGAENFYRMVHRARQ